MALPVEKRLLMLLKKRPPWIFKSTCITSWWLNHPFETYHMIVKSFGLVSRLAAYFMTSPPDHAMPQQSKRRRIDGIAAPTVGEGHTELEVLSISGECMVTLNVAGSMLGGELWKMILDKVPSKRGLQLVVTHTSRLALNKSLQQQGLGVQRAQVSATYIPVNLFAAWRFALGDSVEDEEFSLNGIVEVTGVSHEMPALLHNLPESIHTLEFAPGFKQGLRHVRLPSACKLWLLDATSIRSWTQSHGQPACKLWLLDATSTRIWTMWNGQRPFKV